MNSDYDKHIINASNVLDTLSQSVPDADPGILMATADEISKVASAIRAIKELGLIQQVTVLYETANGEGIVVRHTNEIGEE